VVRPLMVSRVTDGSISTELENRDSVAIGQNAAIVAAGALNLGIIAVQLRRTMP
jgi:hypothetical protein